MAVDVGAISFEADVALKQLKNDLKDDWFPDPLGFADFMTGDLAEEIIAGNFDANHGSYRPVAATLLNVPKSNFTLRYALETSLADRLVYHSIAMHLLPYYDQKISKWAFSHRAGIAGSSARSKAKYVFRSGIDAWNDFLGCVQSALPVSGYLLSTDLANYFENISLAILKDEMTALVPELEATTAEKASIRAVVDQLFGYLASWSFTPERGLPQNRDASSFLANVYMRSVDQAMLGHGYSYFRYMDDIKVVCTSEAQARQALKHLVLALRPLGQSVNGGKTAIVSAENSERIRQCLSAPSIEMRRIAAAWQTKALNPISRTFIPLKNLALAILRRGEFDTREFRFCVNRLDTLARCEEFNVPAAYFAEITPLMITGLDLVPVATDQICRYLRAVDLSPEDFASICGHLTQPDKGIYNWKNYRLWVLLTQKSFVSGEMLQAARGLMASRPDDPTRAGATLYLGAFGGRADRELIASSFRDLGSFLGQRTAVIAVQELHFRAGKNGGPSIETDVRPFLRADLRGTYSALRKSGAYIEPMEPISIRNFVDMERDYD